jgi:putative redox protein
VTSAARQCIFHLKQNWLQTRQSIIRAEGEFLFSPTDLTATSLGTCMLTTMGIVARTRNVDLTGATATVEKEMSSTPPRKINRLTVAIRVPRTTNPENQQRLENAAHTCPVKKSLHPDIETPIEFVWG